MLRAHHFAAESKRIKEYKEWWPIVLDFSEDCASLGGHAFCIGTSE